MSILEKAASFLGYEKRSTLGIDGLAYHARSFARDADDRRVVECCSGVCCST